MLPQKVKMEKIPMNIKALIIHDLYLKGHLNL